MPIVSMESGQVIARSFTPCFDRESMELVGLELHKDNGEDLQIPFDGICFINDICTMVKVPQKPYYLPYEDVCELIGTPLTAKVGSMSLFNFGSIEAADVEDDGKVLSLTLKDGHSFMIPREDSPEKAVVNNAMAADAFNCVNDSLRVTPSIQLEYVEEPSYAPKKPAVQAPAAAAEVKKAESPQLTLGYPKTAPAEKSPEKGQDLFSDSAPDDFFLTPPLSQPVRSSSSRSAQTASKADAGKTARAASREKEPEEKKKKKPLILQFIPPVAAMFIYFFLYFFMSVLFIQA